MSLWRNCGSQSCARNIIGLSPDPGPEPLRGHRHLHRYQPISAAFRVAGGKGLLENPEEPKGYIFVLRQIDKVKEKVDCCAKCCSPGN
jgi:hypothetical protein